MSKSRAATPEALAEKDKAREKRLGKLCRSMQKPRSRCLRAPDWHVKTSTHQNKVKHSQKSKRSYKVKAVEGLFFHHFCCSACLRIAASLLPGGRSSFRSCRSSHWTGWRKRDPLWTCCLQNLSNPWRVENCMWNSTILQSCKIHQNAWNTLTQFDTQSREFSNWKLVWPIPKTRISEAQTSHFFGPCRYKSFGQTGGLLNEFWMVFGLVFAWLQLYSVERFEWSFFWGKFGDVGLRKTSNKVVGDNDAVSRWAPPQTWLIWWMRMVAMYTLARLALSRRRTFQDKLIDCDNLWYLAVPCILRVQTAAPTEKPLFYVLQIPKRRSPWRVAMQNAHGT